jgi:hypothetical protein
MAQCTAITKRGARCRMEAVPGDRRCRRHEARPALPASKTSHGVEPLPDARALFVPHATSARDCIVGLMTSDNERVALSAAKEVLSYACDQSKADVEVSVSGDLDLADIFNGFTRDDLRAIAEGALRGGRGRGRR